MASSDLERPLSALSISSSTKSTSDLDWDRQSSTASVSAPVTPSPRRRHVELPDVEGTPLARTQNTRRPLADLIRLHRDGKDSANGFESLHLTGEEESRLREALNNWVNGDDDDRSFHTLHDDDDSDDASSPRESRTRSTTLNGDESILRELEDAKNTPKDNANA
ncbi:hypothetical protein DL93DRAFT_2166722 [Clavulina sp. PMI_390]|nr:hypothetical protein DL93DRAFT_2166722 [Clavulina sp. PMI_390]